MASATAIALMGIPINGDKLIPAPAQKPGMNAGPAGEPEATDSARSHARITGCKPRRLLPDDVQVWTIIN